MENNKMSMCEYVSPGHPDKVADGITSYILDRYIEKDPNTRYALECQIKDNHVSLAGEVTSSAVIDEEMLNRYVREAIEAIGYTKQYAERWPEGATIEVDKLKVDKYISMQSADIAQGVDNQGWGDQGVFAGLAYADPEHGYMPLDRWYSHKIGSELYKIAKEKELPIGIDIKTQVLLDNERVKSVIVAAPIVSGCEKEAEGLIREIVMQYMPEGTQPNIIINGTGQYVTHASVGDCGTTGRKLAVDFYGLNCPIGGGTTWGKDGTKADVALNLYVREYALRSILNTMEKERDLQKDIGVIVKAGCCIGKDFVNITEKTIEGNVVARADHHIPPKVLIERYRLNKPVFFEKNNTDLFCVVDKVAIENKDLPMV